jgi:Zn-dependent M32 family carboxypeptidase
MANWLNMAKINEMGKVDGWSQAKRPFIWADCQERSSKRWFFRMNAAFQPFWGNFRLSNHPQTIHTHTTMKFKDFNFKLSVISALHELGYYTAEVEAIKRANRDWPEDHTPIPAVLAYYQNLEIDPAYLAEIESYLPDGGDMAYFYLTQAWDGEDDQFDIHSIEGIEHLVNLVSFDAISMLPVEGVDFTPLLACEKLAYANTEFMRKDENADELIQKFLAKGVDVNLPKE